SHEATGGRKRVAALSTLVDLGGDGHLPSHERYMSSGTPEDFPLRSSKRMCVPEYRNSGTVERGTSDEVRGKSRCAPELRNSRNHARSDKQHAPGAHPPVFRSTGTPAHFPP